MEPIINRMLKELPFKPPPDLKPYFNNNIILLTPNFCMGQEAVFSSYHFVIPVSQVPPLKVDKTTHIPEINKIFPVNPEQILNSSAQRVVEPYYAFFLDNHYVSDMVHSMYKKNSVHFENDSFTVSSELLHSIRMFIEEYNNKQPGYEFILDSLTAQITILLIRQIKNDMPSIWNSRSSKGKPNIERAIEYLRECYSQNFSLIDVANIANLSPYHFVRVFKAETGKTPFEYLMDIKIEKSRELLKSTRKSITEIGFSCGFASSGHFAVAFKKKVGISPSDYRRSFEYNNK